jgi:TrmH family RNA methyltransferase
MDAKRALHEVRSTYSKRGRRSSGLCSLEGVRVFERAISSGAQMVSVLVDADFLENASERYGKLRAELESRGFGVHCISDADMQELTGGRELGGIIGLANLPREVGLAQVLENSGEAQQPLLMVAGVGFNDPGNVGALVRTGHASGVAAVLSVGSTDAFHPRSVRTSMGSVFRIPVVTYADVECMARELAELGVRSIGAITSGGLALPKVTKTETPSVVVMGSEAFGLSEAEQALLDELVSIPMTASVDSYSVNAAAAVMLYEMRREA